MAQTILVTGASGFIAAHVVATLLRRGYNVRGTVRSEKSAVEVFRTHSQYPGTLSIAIVPDIAAPGAFDEAVQGVDGIIHTASPFILGATDFETELFRPAIQGTVSILEATQKHNPGVSRIVITSSFASVLDPSQGKRPGYIYTERDWNPVTREEAGLGDGVAAYLASKTFAEQAAWNYIKEKKSLNTSSGDIYRLINGSEKEVPDTSFWAFADVRDLAEAHVLALEKPAAAGKRYLIANSAYSYQQVCDIIRENFPQLRELTPEGIAGNPFLQSISWIPPRQSKNLVSSSDRLKTP
ncbi:hypothetical protein ACCO45_012670 [Purpureocillium lilacinum]|uniref:Uncharacterized protein n=1 Tax=Purpureocillium lilacinum TaxID=33203 RepID=A0ACC4DA85_PURLI